MVQQVLGNGKPAKSSCVNSIPLEKGFSEEGVRKGGEDEEEDEEEEEEKEEKELAHTDMFPCAAAVAACMRLRWHLGALPHSVSLVPKRRSASCH